MPHTMSLLDRPGIVDRQLPGATIETCLFDLDDTLYPLSTGLAAACRKNIEDYMVQKLNYQRENVNEENVRLYKEYGTTMAGLRVEGHNFDFDDYHAFVHGRLPYHHLNEDTKLRNLLHSLPLRKYIFTNGDRIHARRCLQKLNIEDCFHGVICFEDIMECPPLAIQHPCPETLDADLRGAENAAIDRLRESTAGPFICCKPQNEAFLRAVKLTNSDPCRVIMLDDSTRNIAAAKAIGMMTCLVGMDIRTESSDYAISSIHNLREAISELWEPAGELERPIRPASSIAVEYVKA